MHHMHRIHFIFRPIKSVEIEAVLPKKATPINYWRELQDEGVWR